MSKKSFRVTAAALAMRELRKLPPSTSVNRPDRVPIDAITIHEAVFQPRAMNEMHVHGLSKVIKNRGEVDPVVVWPVGDKIMLLDGHHRIEAYKKAGKTDAIPVEYFEGTADDALSQSGALNTPIKLPMTNAERQDFAWRMETLGAYSLKHIADTSGASKAQVVRMRAAKVKLGNLAECFETWTTARRHMDKQEPEGDFDPESWKQEQAAKYAETLGNAFSSKLATNPEVAAMAFSIYFGRKLPDLYHQIGEIMSEEQHQEAAAESQEDV